MLTQFTISSNMRIYTLLFTKTAVALRNPPQLSQLMQAVTLGNVKSLCCKPSCVIEWKIYPSEKCLWFALWEKGGAIWSLTPTTKVSLGSRCVLFQHFCFNLFLVDALLRSHLVFHSLLRWWLKLYCGFWQQLHFISEGLVWNDDLISVGPGGYWCAVSWTESI